MATVMSYTTGVAGVASVVPSAVEKSKGVVPSADRVNRPMPVASRDRSRLLLMPYFDVLLCPEVV